MVSPYVRSIEDMERLFYTQGGLSLLGAGETIASIAKADAPVLTTTTGVYNPVYGAYAWRQLNMEANAFGVLPKTAWLRPGWRAITARTSNSGATGVAENATLPETFKPTFAILTTKPKTHADTFDVSEVQEFLATMGGADSTGDMAAMRSYMAAEHAESINIALLNNSGVVAGNNLESLDRVVGSYDELTNTTDSAGNAFNANDLDIYSQDRDAAASFTDAQVIHNSGTRRVLSDDVVREVMWKTAEQGAKSTMWMTGHDTANDVAGLYQTQVRYMGEAMIKPSVNGIQVLDGQGGMNGGFRVSTLYGYPLIISKDTEKETTSGKSRMYLLDISNPEGFDMPRLCLKVAKPTQYFEAGMNSGTPFAINRLGNEGLYRTMGELICAFFKVQGKIKDLL